MDSALLILLVIGVVAAVILSVADRFLSVPTDERVASLRGALPGANCGACGYAGCNEYAVALAEGAPITLCTPGGADVASALSKILGVEAGVVVAKAAIVKCSGDCDSTSYKMDYQGEQSCEACALLYNGRGECATACIGLGDCARVCPYGAIEMFDGLARVNRCRCVGCGLCVSACPKHIIEVIDKGSVTFVACSSHEKGAAKRKVCTKGCIGCKKCERICEAKAIKVSDNLATVDYEACTNCKACRDDCPVRVIV